MKISIQKLKQNQNQKLKLAEKIKDAAFIGEESILSLAIDFDLEFVNEEFVFVNGFFTVFMPKVCEKCLEEFEHKMVVEFHKEYEVKTVNEEIDLAEDIREEFWLNIPLVYVCKENCKGLCAICGQNLNIKDCGCKIDFKNEEFDNNSLSVLKNLKNLKNIDERIKK